MYDSFTDIELIARHRIAERVRYSPSAPKRRSTPRWRGITHGPDPVRTSQPDSTRED